MQKKNKFAIGVFDSGLGGLTVVKELIRLLPNEDIVYFGDTARVPYGTKSKESIIRFSLENSRVLIKHNVKMIVVACNSSSSYALVSLSKNFNLPIIGVSEPGAKKAVLNTKNKKIGVIATSATIASNKYVKLIKKQNSEVKVYSQSCPLFVPVVEEGWIDKKVTFDIANEYLSGLKKKKVDTLILGCTHYPILKPVLRKVMGKNVCLVDSAQEVVLEVKKVLKKRGLNNESLRKGKSKFLISDKPQKFKNIAKIFLGREIKNIKRV